MFADSSKGGWTLTINWSILIPPWPQAWLQPPLKFHFIFASPIQAGCHILSHGEVEKILAEKVPFNWSWHIMTLSVRWNETANFYDLRMIPWCSCGRCKLSHFQLSYAAFRQDFKAYPIVAEEDAKENTSAKKEARRLRVRDRHLNLRTQCLGGVWSNGCILMFAVLHGGPVGAANQVSQPHHRVDPYLGKSHILGI